MRPFFVLYATVLLSVGTTACGSSGGSTSSVTRSASVPAASSTTASSEAAPQDYRKADRDKDNDFGAGVYDDTNNNQTSEFGHAASPADRQAIATLVKSYYETALAGDGAKACSMLYLTLAEAVAEDYGHGSAGAPYLSQGTTCPTVMALLFKHFHAQLAADLPVLKVKQVRLDHLHGLVILGFGAMPERQISVSQQRHAWKIATILDGEMP